MNRSCNGRVQADHAARACALPRPEGLSEMEVRWLGVVPYLRALRLQRERVARVRAGVARDTLFLLEHPPVVTLGRGADRRHLLLDEAALAARGIELHEAGRGGDVTYHGPGQLVGYPVVALEPGRRDARRYLRDLEEALILAVGDVGIRAGRVPGLTGIWVGRRKLAAIGVRLSTGWITSHGFALNVGSDLSGFEVIVPCGIADRGVTSLAALTGKRFSTREMGWTVARRLADVLGRRVVVQEDADDAVASPLRPPVCCSPRPEGVPAGRRSGGNG